METEQLRLEIGNGRWRVLPRKRKETEGNRKKVKEKTVRLPGRTDPGNASRIQTLWLWSGRDEVFRWKKTLRRTPIQDCLRHSSSRTPEEAIQ